jgi:hypothetical protein
MALHVQLGNSEPTGVDVPAVTYITVPDADPGSEDFDVADVITAISAVSQGGLTGGIWQSHSTATKPDWVWCDDSRVERAIAEHYGIAQGLPRDVEQKYFTTTPPGVVPGVVPEEG